MAWVETASLSFVARHESRDAEAAQEVLDDLERSARSSRVSSRGARRGGSGDPPRPLMLSLAAPWVPLARLVSEPAGRRYFAGFFGRGEIHVLAPGALERRASAVPGSREALLRSPRHEYAHVVLGRQQRVLPAALLPLDVPALRRDGVAVRGRRHPLRRPGAAHARGDRSSAARGPAAALPPASRDAWVLGGTVFSLLERSGARRVRATWRRRRDARTGGRSRRPSGARAGVERRWTDYLAGLTSG